MAKILDRFTVNFTRRDSGKNRPLSSDVWNASLAELSADLAFIQREWNTKLVTLLEDIPAGSEDVTVNAYKFGLSGAHVWMDAAATSATNGGFFWNTSKDRPRTIKEVALKLSQDVASAITTMRAELAASTATLTAAQKTAIGDSIFGTGASTAGSLVGLASSAQQNIIQLAKDLYGTGNYTLNGSGNAILANYSVKDMVSALLTMHAGAWNLDNDLIHQIDLSTETTGALVQTRVAATPTPVNDVRALSAPSTNLLDDLDLIRSVIRRATNSGLAWNTAITPDSSWSGAGQPIDLQDIFDLSGTATVKTAANPWAYTIDDLGSGPSTVAGTTFADSVTAFVGMSSRSDAAPTYSSTTVVTPGVSLETAIGELDAAMLAAVAASGVSIADAGGYFDATNVEDALQYLASGINSSLDLQAYRTFSAVAAEAVTTLAKVVSDSGIYIESTTAGDPWTGFLPITLPDNIELTYFAATGLQGAGSSGVNCKLIKVPSDTSTLSAAYTLFDVTITDTSLTTESETISSGLAYDAQTESLVVYFNRAAGGANYPPAQLVNFTVGYVPLGLIR